MTNYLPTIVENTFTRNDFLRRIHILREYFETVHFSKTKQRFTDYCVLHNIDKTDADAINSWKFTPTGGFSRTAVYGTLESLVKACDVMPVLTLYMPFEPDEQSVHALGKWVRTNVSSQVIIDLRLDPEAMGGVKIAWNGMFADYSISRVLKKHRSTIQEILDEKMKHSDHT